MQELNLPSYHIKTKQVGKHTEVFDFIRKSYVMLTPEEWVRQQFIHFLVHEKNYPAQLISIEKGIKVLGLQKRFDAVIADRSGQPAVLIEFKSPDVKITQKTFEQVSTYNLQLKVRFLMVSNGLKHYCCKVDFEKRAFEFLTNIPEYNELILRD
jgi:hypothetical protein